jgi:hypothetical protein
VRFPEPFYWTSDRLEVQKEVDPTYGLKRFDPPSLDVYHADPSRPRLIAEGDSWFRHPCVKATMAWVEGFGYKIYRSDQPGRKLATMVDEQRYLLPLQDDRRDTILALLLSGGGNDLIWWKKTSSELPSPIFKAGNGSRNPRDYLDDTELTAALVELARLLSVLARSVRALRRDLPIIVHSYDWFEPKDHGAGFTWVNPQLDQIGVPRDQALRNAIGKELIDWLSEAYRDAGLTNDISHVDLRGTVDHRWFDEIHPTGEAFHDVAQKLAAKIPGRPKSTKRQRRLATSTQRA